MDPITQKQAEIVELETQITLAQVRPALRAQCGVGQPALIAAIARVCVPSPVPLCRKMLMWLPRRCARPRHARLCCTRRCRRSRSRLRRAAPAVRAHAKQITQIKEASIDKQAEELKNQVCWRRLYCGGHVAQLHAKAAAAAQMQAALEQARQEELDLQVLAVPLARGAPPRAQAKLSQINKLGNAAGVKQVRLRPVCWLNQARPSSPPTR